MADIKTNWLPELMAGVWSVDGADLAGDDGLETAVLISLFTDAAATDDEMARAGVQQRRGWWGDAWSDIPGDVMGSKLWLLRREKRTAATLARAQGYARDALMWLVEDGVADSVSVIAEAVGTDVLALQVQITRKQRPAARYRFNAFWQGS